MMHKKPYKPLFTLLITGVLFAGTLSGCRESGDPCPMGRQDLPLGHYEKSFMIYQGTETLVFIDLNKNRDTLRFKGTGIEMGIDTSFIRTNENMDYPCIDTTFFECQKIRFVNEKNNNDDITIKISGVIYDNEIVKCLTVGHQGPRYYLRFTSSAIDSMTIDGRIYYELYPLYQNLYYEGNNVFFNKEYGLINYRDTYRNLVLKAIKP